MYIALELVPEKKKKACYYLMNIKKQHKSFEFGIYFGWKTKKKMIELSLHLKSGLVNNGKENK